MAAKSSKNEEKTKLQKWCILSLPIKVLHFLKKCLRGTSFGGDNEAMRGKNKNLLGESGNFLCSNKENAVATGMREASIAIAGLFNTLKDIKVSTELIEQNKYKSVNSNGDVEYYY